MAEEKQPGEIPGGVVEEVRRYYVTRSDVQNMVKPIEDKVNGHLGFHEGARYQLTLLVPVGCVIVTAVAIIVAAFVK